MDGSRRYYSKWNKSKTNTVWFHLYVESKKQNKWTNLIKTESRIIDTEKKKQMVATGFGCGRSKEIGKGD